MFLELEHNAQEHEIHSMAHDACVQLQKEGYVTCKFSFLAMRVFELPTQSQSSNINLNCCFAGSLLAGFISNFLMNKSPIAKS